MRGKLTKSEWADMLTAQGGTCCVEGCASTGPFHGEHANPNYYKPGKPDALMCVPCHKVKTKRDKADIARTRRLNGETLSQAERRRRFGPSLKSRNTFEDRNRNG